MDSGTVTGVEFLNNLISAVFFLVRKFYMSRCLFEALYVDMRYFGVSWVFSKHKIPHPNQWGSMITTKKYCLFNEDLRVVGFICTLTPQHNFSQEFMLRN